MATLGIMNIEYLGFITRNLENILALFHLQGFGICHFYKMEPNTNILIYFSFWSVPYLSFTKDKNCYWVSNKWVIIASCVPEQHKPQLSLMGNFIILGLIVVHITNKDSNWNNQTLQSVVKKSCFVFLGSLVPFWTQRVTVLQNFIMVFLSAS